MNLIKRPLVYMPLIVLLIAAGVGVYFIFYVSRDPIPQNIRSQVSFTLFYPKSLPSGWSIDKKSFYADAADQVVGYRLKGPNGNLNITIQPVPKNFDFNNFYTKRLSNTVQFLTPLGQGAVGTAGGQLVGSLETTTSWVLASPNSTNIKTTDIQSIFSDLIPASP
jgi:hypothetical protein